MSENIELIKKEEYRDGLIHGLSIGFSTTSLVLIAIVVITWLL